MHLDLRLPIGVMLLTFGLILVADGFVRGVLVLGLNVNLWWGLAMAFCGAGMLAWAKRRSGRGPGGHLTRRT